MSFILLTSSFIPISTYNEFIPILTYNDSDHAFDLHRRKRLRKRIDHVATERNAVQKGALGVRWEKARTNYSKMLPTKRMGIE